MLLAALTLALVSAPPAVAIEPPVIDPGAMPPDETGPDQPTEQRRVCSAPTAFPNSNFADKPWASDYLRIGDAQKFATGAGVTVAVIDTGVNGSPRVPAEPGGDFVDKAGNGMSDWELISDQHVETFADVRSRVGINAAGLFVLAGEATPARRRVLDPAIYREAIARLDRHFTISIIDCGSTMDTPVTQEVLRDLDALIVVTSPWADGAAAAGQTLDWLADRGLTGLLQRTVVVLNDSDGHADRRTRSILAQQFGSQGQVVIEVPFDGHLRPGGVIDRTAVMSPLTRRRFVEIVAALAEHFPSSDDRSRERY